jgi:hypothetical protein
MSTPDQVRVAAREALSTLPDDTVDARRVLAAATVLREYAQRWARLAPGEELVLDWPEPRRRR